jgi:hypothetical protein
MRDSRIHGSNRIEDICTSLALLDIYVSPYSVCVSGASLSLVVVVLSQVTLYHHHGCGVTGISYDFLRVVELLKVSSRETSEDT